MKWIWNRCHRRRRDISLLAAGALGREAKGELERHLAVCEECQKYYNEMKALTAPLAEWEKLLSPVEATPVLQIRWARAVREADRPNSIQEPMQNNIWRTIWQELIWPSRLAWTGMAALWIVMLAINGRLSDHPINGTGASSAQDWGQVWEEQNHVLAELIGPALVIPAAPPANGFQSAQLKSYAG